jgi:hypothetical protein
MYPDDAFTDELDPDNTEGDFFGEVPGQLELDLGITAPTSPQALDEQKRQLAATLDERRKSNVDKYKDMLALNAQPDPMGVVMIRINLALDALLGEDTVARLDYENTFEDAIGEMLAECLQQARQRALTHGINPYSHATNGASGVMLPKPPR